MRGIYISMFAASAIAVAGTVAVVLFPGIDPVSGAPSLQAAAGTVPSLLALVAASLALGRFQRSGRLNELVLAGSLGTLALSGLVFVTVPLIFQHFWPAFSTWAALAASAFGAVLFTWAAFAPRRRLRHCKRAKAAAVAVVTAALLLIALLAAAARLPALPAAATAHSLPARPGVDADAVLPATELAVAALYVLAAVGFVRRSGRFHDRFFGWLAISAVLAAAAHVNFFLYPGLYQHFVSVGDVLVLCFYAILLGASVQDGWSYWRAAPEAAVLAERRRIARDLHDGPAQELAYLRRNIDSLNGWVDAETKARLWRAAERAELDIRLAIDAIAMPRSQSVNTALTQATSEIAARNQVKLELDVVPGIQLPPRRADALVRIACEAISNAARHSGAERVSLSLQRWNGGVCLRVIDHGSGFDPVARSDGYGLTSMRDRVSSVGGDLRISSEPEEGTEVEVRL
jgi:signal transduction histidine kinase